jgi:hypothetical protein
VELLLDGVVVLYLLLALERVDWVAERFTELDREEVLERSTATPVLASYALPEESIILVLDAVELPRLLNAEALLPETVERVALEDLPERVEVLPEVEFLPEREAVADDVRLAELVR